MIFRKMVCILTTAIVLNTNIACASQYPRVDQDIATYDKIVEKMNSDFANTPKNPNDITWVKSKLDTMFNIDQYMRRYTDTPFKNKYSKEEESEFRQQFMPRFSSVDSKNTLDLKELLKIYEWIKISIFGEKADNQGFLIVLHADADIEFQKHILSILEKLWPIGETKPVNYAYLYDRVASSSADQSKRVPQRFGTQGRCVGPATWEPWPIEDATNVDQRRKSVGLNTMEEYKKLFKDICH